MSETMMMPTAITVMRMMMMMIMLRIVMVRVLMLSTLLAFRLPLIPMVIERMLMAE